MIAVYQVSHVVDFGHGCCLLWRPHYPLGMRS